jgi:hypothetical protein
MFGSSSVCIASFVLSNRRYSATHSPCKVEYEDPDFDNYCFDESDGDEDDVSI